jgi:rSAM/selenodomain-associated transferase 2
VLSIVIPTLNPGPRFGQVLAALVSGAVEGLVKDVIVVDAGSTDRTLELSHEAGARMVTTQKSRGGQMRAGADAAKGDWLLFLHADTILSPQWVRAASDHMGRHPGKAGYFRLRFDDPSGFARTWEKGVALRCAVLGLPYGDQGLLISRALYEEVGGFPDWPLMEDVEFVHRLGRSRLRLLDAEAHTDAEKYRRDGWMARSARNLVFLTAWGMGTDPKVLARRYV